MINKIRAAINEVRDNSRKSVYLQQLNKLHVQELEWAHIFHDSIRGKKYIEELSLNIGRWAGNYSFFYVLNRILSDYKPEKILDLGLGESSKLISTYLEHYLPHSNHTIVEQDEKWALAFSNRFQLSERSKIVHCPLQVVEIKGFQSQSYTHFKENITGKFDLYIVDGPFGSERYSRYDIISLVENFDASDEFIIMMDDTNRPGERDTRNDIVSLLKSKNISHHLGDYQGNKTVSVICSDQFKFATSF